MEDNIKMVLKEAGYETGIKSNWFKIKCDGRL
jgi:hypothetical protein